MFCLLLHKSPEKEFLKAQNKPYEENQEKLSKYDMNSSDNTSLKKSKCVLEEGFVWAFLTTGVSGCLLPRGKARPLPSPLRCFLAVILQVCRCPRFPITTCFLTAAVGVKVYDGIWKRINIPVIGQGGKLRDLSRANLDNDQWRKWSLYSRLVSTMPSGDLFFPSHCSRESKSTSPLQGVTHLKDALLGNRRNSKVTNTSSWKPSHYPVV